MLYLAAAAKSNAGYKAYNQMRRFVKENASDEVPVHLRNAPTKLMKVGYGREYRYAHDELNAYAAYESYMPDGLTNRTFTNPSRVGWKSKSAKSWHG